MYAHTHIYIYTYIITSIYINNTNKPMFTVIYLLNRICLMTYVGILHITLD